MNKEISPAEVCKKTRRLTSEAFLKTVKKLWKTSFSEKELEESWLAELRSNNSLFPSGWYSPPPDGIGILFGRETEPKRLNYDSLRPERNHPQADIYFDQETGLAYVYASPVDRTTGVIGDLGMTLYAGNDPEIIAHLQKVHQVNHAIVKEVLPGVKISDAYQKACDIFEAAGLTNNVTSTTDPMGINIGHSVPGTLEAYSKQELALIQDDDWEKTCQAISKRRVFFNGQVDYAPKPRDCFTLEPRLTNPEAPHLPMVSFHTIVRVTEEGAELLENFEPIFRAVAMDYMFR